MARVRKPVEIDGIEFEIGQVSGLAAYEAAMVLLRVHGETLGAYGRGGGHAVAGLGLSLAEMAQQMQAPEYRSKVFQPLLGQCTQANRRVLDPAVEEELFVGKPGMYVKLLKAAIEHNCGNFLPDFASSSDVVRLASNEVATSLNRTQGAAAPAAGTSGAPSSES